MKIIQSFQFTFFVVFTLLAQKIPFILSKCVHGNLYSHETDCGRFYQCAHGQLFGMTCYPGLQFNPSINVCDYPENVLCKLEPETTDGTTPGTTHVPITTTATPAPTKTPATPKTTISTTPKPITTTIQAVPIPDVFKPSDIQMQWSHAGPIAGKHCVHIVESADPHTWNDNYLCFKQDYGVRWSSSSAISGMKCTRIVESADPHTWGDNYLCVPTTSQFDFSWSSAGTIPNLSCIQMLEPADPHTWDDNYLCLRGV